MSTTTLACVKAKVASTPRVRYGKHLYTDRVGTSNCEYGCGCWMGNTRSGGPKGVDPLGKCPNNPLKPKRR